MDGHGGIGSASAPPPPLTLPGGTSLFWLPPHSFCVVASTARAQLPVGDAAVSLVTAVSVAACHAAP